MERERGVAAGDSPRILIPGAYLEFLSKNHAVNYMRLYLVENFYIEA